MKPRLQAAIHSKSFLLHFMPTAVVFLAFLTVTIWAFYSAVDSVEREQERAVSRQSETAQEAIAKRLSNYEEILRGGVGLFIASDDVTRDEWARYVSSYRLNERYPGIQGIGYAKLIRPGELQTHQAQMQESGVSEYTVTPQGIRSVYTAITYLEPLDERNRRALGYDMFTDPVRRKAMERARDTGEPSFTEKVTLVQEIDNDKQAGFLVYMPIYAWGAPTSTVEERRAALEGYVYAPFRAGNLLGGIFRNEPESVGLRIYSNEAAAEQLLYENKAYRSLDERNDTITHEDVMQMDGVEWIVSYKFADTIVPDALRQRPISILLAGTLLSVLTAGLVLTLLTARTRALASSKEREVQSAKDDLLSLASHQLRTPATGVKQYIGMILEGYAGTLRDEQRMYLEKAYESNERQLHIINELLYVAKADAGRIVLAKRAIRINELIKDIVAEQRQSAKDAGVSLKVKLPARDRTIRADKYCLRMAIENLLTNAIKYTPQGGKVRVIVAEQDSSLLVTVKDTGVGIDQQDMPMLFTQFSRIPNSMSSQTSGSGIGLYLSKSLIELHGGTITVDSKVGKGSSFVICIPYK